MNYIKPDCGDRILRARPKGQGPILYYYCDEKKRNSLELLLDCVSLDLED